MKIAILGTGAMGSVYAALLAEAGNEVWAIDVWQDHVDAINRHGLKLSGASGDRRVQRIRASTDSADAGACDLYIIATKASGVGDSAAAIQPLKRDDSLVLTIQNGLGAAERIAAHMPVDNVILGVAEGFGASMRGPGEAHHNAMNKIRLGEINGGITDRLERIEQLWREAGFNAQAYADIEQLIWEKFLCNVTFSGSCTVFDGTIGEVMRDPKAWAIARELALEVDALARAKGVAVSYDDAVEYVTAFGQRMPDARPSMLLDHHAGRRSEIDAINGMVPVIGAQLGIATPYNSVVSAIIRVKEQAFSG